MMIVGEVDPFERWTWHLLAGKLDVECACAPSGDERTRVRSRRAAARRLARTGPPAALRPRPDGCRGAP